MYKHTKHNKIHLIRRIIIKIFSYEIDGEHNGGIFTWGEFIQAIKYAIISIYVILLGKYTADKIDLDNLCYTIYSSHSYCLACTVDEQEMLYIDRKSMRYNSILYEESEGYL